MSYVQDRVEQPEGGNVEFIDVYKASADITSSPKDGADSNGDLNNNLGIDNPIYEPNDSIALS